MQDRFYNVVSHEGEWDAGIGFTTLNEAEDFRNLLYDLNGIDPNGENADDIEVKEVNGEFVKAHGIKVFETVQEAVDESAFEI